MSAGTSSWQRPCCHPGAAQQRRCGLSYSPYGYHKLFLKSDILNAPTFRQRLRTLDLVVRSTGEGVNVAARGIVWSGASKDSSVSTQLRHGIPKIGVVSYKDDPDIRRAAVENMARAFADDPSTVYFCRPEQRVQFYRAVLSCALEWYPGERQLACTFPPEAAAIVYVYPRPRPAVSWFTQLRMGLGALMCVRPGRLMAGLEASEYFEALREEFLQAHGPFLYVSVIAVQPGRQGAGLGSALLAFLCDRADASGLHTYIEATSLRNRALYERFGFHLIQEWRANSEMPDTFVMCRSPNPQCTTGPHTAPHIAPSTCHPTVASTAARDAVVDDIEQPPANRGTTASFPRASPSAHIAHESRDSQPAECGSRHVATAGDEVENINSSDKGSDGGSGVDSGRLKRREGAGARTQSVIDSQPQLPELTYPAQQNWQEAWLRRRRRFADWRRRRREEAQQQGGGEGNVAEAAVLPYVEVDEHDYWPLWSSSLAFDDKSVEDVFD